MELDIDIALEFGRNFQQTDSVYHGATWDTAKLLCDTIERLRDQVEKAKSLVEVALSFNEDRETAILMYGGSEKVMAMQRQYIASVKKEATELRKLINEGQKD